MKRIVVTFFMLVIVIQNGFCLFGEIFEAVKIFAGQINEVTDEIFRKTMIKQTIDTVAILKKNYEDSMRFYREIKYLQENPYGFVEDTKQTFLNRLEDPRTKFWSEVDKKQREIDMKEQKKWYEKGIASYAEEQTLGKGLEYMKENLNFGDRIVERMRRQNEQIKKITNDLSSNDKNKVESAKTEIALLQLETMQQQTAILLQLFELQTIKQQEEYLQRKMLLEKQKLFAQTAKEILQKRAQKTQQEKTTREQKIREILRAISDKELKK